MESKIQNMNESSKSTRKIVLKSKNFLDRFDEFFMDRFFFVKMKNSNEFYILNAEKNIISETRNKRTFFSDIRYLCYKFNIAKKCDNFEDRKSDSDIQEAFDYSDLLFYADLKINDKKNEDVGFKSKSGLNIFNSNLFTIGNYLEVSY
jgi:hypothetical protein